ncbi:MAG: nucleotide exchange factor GrpE [bacterium]
MSKHEKHHKEEKTEQKPIAEQEQATQEATPTEAEVNEAAPAPAEAKPTTESELAAMKDRYMRLMADFDNFRKRQIREREEWIKRANESLLADFLPVVDHLHIALDKETDSSNPFVSGVKMVYDQFVAALEKNNVVPVDAKGQPFNPEWHEALSQIPSDTVPANEVIEQFRRGWSLSGRLLRPAQVIVSAGKPDAQ